MSTEKIKAGAFILNEGPGQISRETITVATGQNLVTGTVLGKITADGKYAAYANGASDGTETAVGILLSDTDATSEDVEAVMIARMSEVAEEDLTGLDADARADLQNVSIIVRA